MIVVKRAGWMGAGFLAMLVACEEEPAPSATQKAAAEIPSAKPVAAPTPAPLPAPSAVAQDIKVPKWANDYAEELCKRVAVCREKMLGKVPPQQQMMLAMQIPTKEACLKNTLDFKESPKAELDASEQKALAKCLSQLPRTACGDVQTGKAPECREVATLVAKAQGKEPPPK